MDHLAATECMIAGEAVASITFDRRIYKSISFGSRMTLKLP